MSKYVCFIYLRTICWFTALITPNLGLGQAETARWELSPGLASGWQNFNSLNHHLLPPVACVSRKLEKEAEPELQPGHSTVGISKICGEGKSSICWFAPQRATTARARPGILRSQNSASPMRVVEIQALGHPPLFSQSHQQGDGWHVKQLRLKLASVWDTDITGGSLALSTTGLASQLVS